jgi:DNA-binding transcriptional MocR family regulator
VETELDSKKHRTYRKTHKPLIFIEPSSERIKYTTIVEAISGAIKAGRLRPGDQLPPQRGLATQLGIALGTVSRAYAAARQMNLISGRIGQGTFVSRAQPSNLTGWANGDNDQAGIIDLRINRPPTEGVLEEVRNALKNMAKEPELSRLLEHQPSAGMFEHRASGAEWVRESGVGALPENVVICSGVQHALAAAFGALSRPGDLVVTEELAHPGIRLISNLYDLRVLGLPMDRDGLIPDGLAEQCSIEPPKFLICTPSIHNPTCAVMPERRRQEIAELARRYDITIFENDIFGPMLRERAPAIASMAPERSLYITGTTKCVAAGIRVGYLIAPLGLVPELTTAVQATTWMTPPMMVEIVSNWIRDGTLAEITEWQRGEASIRQQLAADILKDFSYSGHESSYQLWIDLPAPWRMGEFMKQLQRRGVRVLSAEEFVVGREVIPLAVRVCLGGYCTREEVVEGLRRLASLIEEGPRLEESES